MTNPEIILRGIPEGISREKLEEIPVGILEGIPVGIPDVTHGVIPERSLLSDPYRTWWNSRRGNSWTSSLLTSVGIPGETLDGISEETNL